MSDDAGESCDYLVIGGGAAGCIIARRLAERTSGRIILVEAGKSDEGDPAANDLSKLDDQTAAYDWGFAASPLPGSAATLKYSRARILGGCANHNDCAFLLPPDSDLAMWEARGAIGWGPDATRHYFRRIEERVNVDRYQTSPNAISRAFVAACQEAGLPANDFRSRIASGTGWFPLNARGAQRHATSTVYLHPLAALPKHLSVWTETFVSRLLIENGAVVGAQTSRGPVRARREVILTAGSIQTPQLMLLSGLGPAEHLRSHGIAIAADLQGVGRNLLDHVAAAMIWELKQAVPPWQLTPLEPVTMITVDEDAPAPDVLFHFGLRVREKYLDRKRFSGSPRAVKAAPNVARARSQGEIRLASADPHAKPVIDLRYFTDPEGYDQRILLAGLRYGRRIASTPTWQRIAHAELSPGPGVQSDDELIAYMREVCETVYHPCGTCVMGDPAEKRVVVGPDLKVKGIDRLRVCDASVFPSMISVNIANTVMMVAEKAADHIAGVA